MLSPSQNVSNNGSYSNDREIEMGVDASSGGFFFSDFKKHDDLKEMLDSNKDGLKLEAMRRIIGMIAKGRDASVLFPAVVKNVVSKNIEVKKLVYVYLERYAEEQQDLALLSISTFQRALKEPNPLIRAGALRVLSSVRVKMIAPIVMLAIRDASADMSSYVRKTAAHAIPKLYSLDGELKDELVEIIQKLLEDKTVLVIGSAVMAFKEVCPERIDLIHRIYRKLCALLIDVDEWGQVIIINVLTRYARMQFADPNIIVTKPTESDESSNDSDTESNKTSLILDPDHRLLLRSTRPLLQSRNSAVVMAVAQLYAHAAPRSEMQLAAKALVRLLRSHAEVQCVVLSAIESISLKNRGLFENYLKSFFVRNSDPTDVKLLKLNILTNLTTECNVAAILRELQTYISNSDKRFVAATIQAIGRCACTISVVTDSCLNGLVSLLSNKDEAVVAESVVVIKRLLQTQNADVEEIVQHMARLLDGITVAQARAAILWLLGEHSQKVPKIAPDVLRKIAKTFADEDDVVKFQAMNLAIKLYITNQEQTDALCRYVLNLALYDQNYDVRDKARLLRRFMKNDDDKLTKAAARIFLASKPAPWLRANTKETEEFQLGSLSHYVKQSVNGYEPLPNFPENPVPCEARNVEPFGGGAGDNSKETVKREQWSSSEDNSESSDESLSEESSSEAEETEEENKGSSSTLTSNEDESSSDYSSSSEASGSESGSPKKTIKKPQAVKKINNEQLNLDLLLDLSDISTPAPTLLPSTGEVDSRIVQSKIRPVQPTFFPIREEELLNRFNGKGLSATYRFTRIPHLFSPNMANINIVFTNNTTDTIENIRIGKSNLTNGMNIQKFSNLPALSPKNSLSASLGIDFNDTAQSAHFELVCSLGNFNVQIKPSIGELLRPVVMDEEIFIEEQGKLKGMNEHSMKIKKCPNDIVETVNEVGNLGRCDSQNQEVYRFSGLTLASDNLCLITVQVKEEVTVMVNSGNMIFEIGRAHV